MKALAAVWQPIAGDASSTGSAAPSGSLPPHPRGQSGVLVFGHVGALLLNRRR
jgi:hypothetical protein